MPADDTALAARCAGVGLDYRTEAGDVVRALRGVDAGFARGRVTVLAGPSGSGKSTLLRILTGVRRPQHGRVEIDGHELTALRTGARRRLRRRRIGVVLQDPAHNLVPYLRAAEQIDLAATLRGRGRGESPTLLAAAGLADRADALPAELSGGEQQRVAFAAAAVGGPALLLADEPTAELDGASATRLVETMRALAGRGTTLVVASHDAEVIAAADDVVWLRDGEVVGS